MLIETDWSTNDYPYDQSNVNDISKLLLHAVDIIAQTLELEYNDVVEYLVDNTQRFLNPLKS